MLMRLAFALFFVAAPLSVSAAEEALTGRATVIDGDTIEIQGKRVRLTGIDAPESDQPCQLDGKSYRCGQQAALALADRVSGKNVTCRSSEKDRYGRILGQCYLGEEDINRWMVVQGHALAYRQYSTLYVADEDQAKAAKRGVWAGTIQTPADYRRDKKSGREVRDANDQVPRTSSGKQCKKGKPCGNSCIAMDKTCRK